ncbi:asparagine synthase (glutamine-hydrolyzing) [Knoellia locipacati]|uniref:asparagine synthase (glutamine-hydrolyzing) n=1 Tax=Knoellia locipacati TaxID=882824 RepID=A0A512T3M2_9MICO|nr:asparagine synthase (glutamine-hydrolyzing) [Knoellia locipacati]GEQ14816.1 asparagine synthetase B [Knoellia locipacati]
MCGIVGILGARNQSAGPLVERMVEAVVHRGPDGDGVWSDEDRGVGLGHSRLAIVDLSPTGAQPMTSHDGRWVLVLNGEIYDHADHRERLSHRGVHLRGTSDTEVLLELVALDGVESALRSVDGMFAIGVWDRDTREFTLARDRLGEKPLLYGRVGPLFAFASELGALRLLPGAPTSPDPEALTEYLRLGYVPAPLSILPGVRKLPPGSLLTVDAAGQAGEPVAYWSLADASRSGLGDPLVGDDAELTDHLDEALRTSVRRRLVADVPVGAFLSGGVDSSVVAAVAQAVSSGPVRTFTVAVGGTNDESGHAAKIAAHLGTDHTTLPLPELDALTLAERVAATYDEPFADPSAVPTTVLCAAAREHVTVCLSGDGADELFGGYNRHRVATGTLSRVRALPSPVRRGIAHGIRRVPVTRWDALATRAGMSTPDVGTKAHKLAHAVRADSVTDAYAALATMWVPSSLMLAPSPALLPRSVPSAHDALAELLLTEQQVMLPDNMLVKVDRASMAVALEVRVPFLDHRLVELSWRLPATSKIRGGQGKWIERDLLDRYVPRELWDRPKVGFDPPLAQWLRGPLREWACDLLAPERLRRQGLIRPEPVTRALESHLAGRENHDYRLWTVLMMQSWLDLTGWTT